MDLPKYPVVLVHGLAAKNFPFINAFGSIPRFLARQGLQVSVPNHDGVGTIAGNARQLVSEIEAICKSCGAEKVNLIAHSKGGLDVRYLITHLGMASRVASVTTLSTPHRGSRLCASILKGPKPLIKLSAWVINLFFRIMGDRNPDILSAARELTGEAMAAFNRCTPNHPDVYYQSYASQVSKANAFLVYLPYQISRHCEQDETDGLVSVHSSQWGDYQGQIDGHPNHVQMVALTPSKKKRRAVGNFYLQIITQLRDKGF